MNYCCRAVVFQKMEFGGKLSDIPRWRDLRGGSTALTTVFGLTKCTGADSNTDGYNNPPEPNKHVSTS
jgi:hypothetical protein